MDKELDPRNATVAAPQGEIARLLDELNMATMKLQDNSNMLSDSLRPILRNEQTGEALGKEQADASTDLGNFLHTLIARVNATNRVVMDSRNRLEL